jgi:hypothetical protein
MKPSDFSQTVNKKISDYFGVKFQPPRLTVHEDSDFAISSFAQIAEFGEIKHPKLPLEQDGFKVKKHQLDAFKKLAVGTNGLTVGEGANKIVHILNNANWQATLIHESLHFYSHPAFTAFVGKDLDEGTTESFAREIMKQLDSKLLSTRGKVYTHEVVLADEFINTIDRERVKAAYFKGDVKAIKDLILAGFAGKALKKSWAAYKSKNGSEDSPFWKLLA